METFLHIVIYVIGGLYVVLALGLLFAWYRTKHPGTVLMAFIYAGAAAAAIGYMHWWPLVAGLVLAWVIRMMGLEPDTNNEGS